MFLTTPLLIIGLILLVYGADRLVYSAAVRSRTRGTPPWLMGCNVVAFGASPPGLMISVTAGPSKEHNLAVENIIGFDNNNILLIAGDCAFQFDNVPR